MGNALKLRVSSVLTSVTFLVASLVGESPLTRVAQGRRGIRVHSAYLPQVSPGIHPSRVLKGRMNSWVGCASNVQGEILTLAYTFLGELTISDDECHVAFTVMRYKFDICIFLIYFCYTSLYV